MPASIAIQQPNYIPWIGSFDLMRGADVCVWLDDVQYTRGDWRNRNRIADGDRPMWLTVPVRSRGRFGQRILDAEIDYRRDWPAKHLAAVRQSYGGAPFFDEVFPAFEAALAARPARLVDLTIPLSESMAASMEIRPRFVRSSSLGVAPGEKAGRVLTICRQLGCGTYLSGPKARAYVDAAEFARQGVEVRYAAYGYPPSPRGPHPPAERLSALDALFWTGPRAVRAFLDEHGRFEPTHASVGPQAHPPK